MSLIWFRTEFRCRCSGSNLSTQHGARSSSLRPNVALGNVINCYPCSITRKSFKPHSRRRRHGLHRRKVSTDYFPIYKVRFRTISSTFLTSLIIFCSRSYIVSPRVRPCMPVCVLVLAAVCKKHTTQTSEWSEPNEVLCGCCRSRWLACRSIFAEVFAEHKNSWEERWVNGARLTTQYRRSVAKQQQQQQIKSTIINGKYSRMCTQIQASIAMPWISRIMR